MPTNTDWRPDQKILDTICTSLKDSSCPDTSKQKMVLEQLNYWSTTFPDFILYLAWIFSFNSQSSSIRTMTGLLLKNELLKLKQSMNNTISQKMPFIQQTILHSLHDSDMLISSTSGTLIASIISTFGLQIWPNIFDQLYDLMRTNQSLIEASLSAICKICEDASGSLVSDFPNIVNTLISRLLECIEQLPATCSKHAIQAINQFIFHQPQVLTEQLEKFVTLLSRQASDRSSIEIQQLVCKSIVNLFESYLVEMLPIIPSIMEYMLNMLSCDQEELALESCEFWLSLSYHMNDIDSSIMNQVFSKLFPLIFKGMIYSEEDPIYIENEQDTEADSTDNDTNIVPRHHHSHQSTKGVVKKETITKHHHIPSVLEEGELEDDTEDDENEEELSDWNLRKCCAATLDSFSVHLTEYQINNFVLSLISQHLNHTEWKSIEVGILALGAIAPGCYETLKPHLYQIIPMLISCTKHERPLIRFISFWTLGRFSEWMIEQLCANRESKYFESCLMSILQAIHQDQNKRSRGCAISAFNSLAESSQGAVLYPYLDAITSAIQASIPRMQRRNLLSMIESIAVLGSVVGRQLGDNPEWFKRLFPPLVEYLNVTDDENSDVFPIFEALTCLTLSFGSIVENWGNVLYNRSVDTWTNGLRMKSGDTSYDEDLCISAMELLGALVQVIPKQSMIRLFDSKNENIKRALYSSMDYQHAGPSARQTAFGLFGDFCHYCPEYINGIFQGIEKHFSKNITPTISDDAIDIKQNDISIDLANNVVWSLGELSLVYPNDLKPYSVFYLDILIKHLIHNIHYPQSFVDNVAISLGRFCHHMDHMTCASHILPHIKMWANVLIQNEDASNAEQSSAWIGLSKMLQSLSNESIRSYIPLLCEVLSSCKHPNSELKGLLQKYQLMLKSF